MLHERQKETKKGIFLLSEHVSILENKNCVFSVHMYDKRMHFTLYIQVCCLIDEKREKYGAVRLRVVTKICIFAF